MTKLIKCISPIDGSVYAERPALSLEAAEAVVASAKAAQKEWARRPLAERIELVQAGVAELGKMTNEIVLELAHMMGRPVRYGGKFGGVEERASGMAAIATEALKPIVVEDSDDFERRIEREPHGVVLVIAPWNYPYLTAINTVSPALIAGNNFGFVNFTGSVGGGQTMERAAAGTFTGVGTELGGKDPGYVMDDADLDAAVDTLIDAAMFNSGQCCCGIERIYVIDSLYDAFVEKAVAIVNGYKLGNPLDAETTIGPMANIRFAEEVRAQTMEAIHMGATALIDIADFPMDDDNGTYLMPQILTDVNHDMRVMRDESFGPVVGIMKVSSDEEAIELMNDSEFGLTCSLWTNDAERAARIGRELETGTVFMNRADYLNPGLCWTGCKNTGRGGALSVLGFQNLTRPKSYHLKKVTS